MMSSSSGVPGRSWALTKGPISVEANVPRSRYHGGSNYTRSHGCQTLFYSQVSVQSHGIGQSLCSDCPASNQPYADSVSPAGRGSMSTDWGSMSTDSAPGAPLKAWMSLMPASCGQHSVIPTQCGAGTGICHITG